MRRAVPASVLALVVLAGEPVARAGAPESAAAETLFVEGRKLLEEGRYAEACAKLADSQELDPAIGTLLNLADCYEKNGQTASAWATFIEAASLAGKSGDTRAQVAARRVELLAPRLSKLTITLASGVAGVSVTRNGALVRAATFGVGVPVDPGTYTVVATAPGKKPWSTTVEVAPDGAAVVVEVPALDDEKSETTRAEPESGSTPVQHPEPRPEPPPAPDQESPNRSRSQRALAYVAGSVGLAGIVVGSVFGLKAKRREHDSEEYCGPEDLSVCSPRGGDIIDEAETAATIANVGFVVGGVALAGGLALFLTAPAAERRPAASLRIAPAVDRDSAGARITATF